MAYKTVIDENGSIGYNLYFENTYGNKIKYTTFGANLEEAENIFVHVCGDEGRTAVIYQGSVINAIGDTSQNQSGRMILIQHMSLLLQIIYPQTTQFYKMKWAIFLEVSYQMK